MTSGWRGFFDKTPKWNVVQLLFVSLSLCSFTMNQVFSKLAHFSMMSATSYVIYYVILAVICLPFIYIQLKLGGTLHKGIIGIVSGSTPFLKGAAIAALITAFIRSLTDTYHLGILAFYAFQSLKSPFTWETIASVELYDAEKSFLWNDVRKASDGIDDTGRFLWWLLACNVAVWGIIFIGICGGLKWVGSVLAVLGSSALILSFTLLTYGRKEFVQSSSPERNFYKVDWDESVAPDILTAFTQRWIPLINLTVLISSVFFGSYPTIGKCVNQKSTLSQISWVPMMFILVVMPHLFINMLAPYLDAAATVLGVTDSQLIAVSGVSTDSLFLLLPKILSALNVKRAISFIWFLTLFIFTLMHQVLHGAVIVDNITEWLRTSSLNCFTHKASLTFVVSFIYCTIGIVFSLPMVTQGGYYVVNLVSVWSQKSYGIISFAIGLALIISYARLHISLSCPRMLLVIICSLGGLFCSAIFIYSAKFDEEIQPFVVLGRNETPVEFPSWAYALGWVVCLGPIVIGFLLGLIHACCSPEKMICASRTFTDEDSTDDQDDVIERKTITSKAGYIHGYLAPSKMRRY